MNRPENQKPLRRHYARLHFVAKSDPDNDGLSTGHSHLVVERPTKALRDTRGQLDATYHLLQDRYVG